MFHSFSDETRDTKSQISMFKKVLAAISLCTSQMQLLFSFNHIELSFLACPSTLRMTDPESFYLSR